MYKLFVAIVSDRILKWANTNNLLSDCQKGFRQGEGCYENTFMLQSIVKDARNNGKKLSIAWPDLLLAVSLMKQLTLLLPIWVSLWN